MHHLVIHGIGQADALLFVRPGVVIQARKEVATRDDQHAPLFEPAIEFLGGDGQTGKPQPQEERAFGLVNEIIDPRQLLAQQRDGPPRFFLVVGAYHGPAEAGDRAGANQVQGQGRA